ncbi:MAG: class I SAM-dependent methyltransferase [Campylobacteraceae bacterium]|nr:class I SAM-dependent methyltransferase [Campylobacteraceae bacterium]
MKEFQEEIIQTFNEMYLVETLNLNNKCILDLGCGNAKITKEIKNNGFDRSIYACEIDIIQHKKNLLNNDGIIYKPYGAEELGFNDETFDMVFMFKSFHHIPKNLMKQALSEIKRVLKPNGLLYISEPLFKGKHNELIAMFHNEKEVRAEAFLSIEQAVKEEKFKLFQEIFFNAEISYNSFEEFSLKHINQSYNNNELKEELYLKIKEKYLEYSKNDKAEFLKPFRVDILQKI